MFDLYYQAKYNLLDFKLNPRHQRRLAIGGHFIIVCLMRPIYYLLVGLFFLFHLYLSLIFYSTLEEKFYSVLRLIFLNILWLIFFAQSFGYLWVGFILWFSTTTYCKYKFNEINEKLILCVKYSDVRLLMYAIREHNYIEIIVKQCNHFFRIIHSLSIISQPLLSNDYFFGSP